ncbi:hypothetical protein [Streptomyces coeruleorubidus]
MRPIWCERRLRCQPMAVASFEERTVRPYVEEAQLAEFVGIDVFSVGE